MHFKINAIFAYLNNSKNINTFFKHHAQKNSKYNPTGNIVI